MTNCTVCRSESAFETDHPETKLYRCPTCDHCFADLANIEQVTYDDSYFDEGHKNWFENPDLKLFNRIAQLIEAYTPGKSVVDVGCGRGDMLRYFTQRLPETQLTGVDIAATPSIDGVELIQDNFLKANLGRQFDAVLSSNMIEHVDDIHGFVEKLRSLIRPGGIAIITTINERSTVFGTARFLRALGKPLAFDRLYSISHLQHFNYTSLDRLFQENRFQVIARLRHNQPLKSVDMPVASPIGQAISLSGLAVLFAVGRMVKMTHYQTVAFRI